MLACSGRPARACCSSAPNRASACPRASIAELSLVQGFRPDFLALQRAGYSVAPEPEGERLRRRAGPLRPPSRTERSVDRRGARTHGRGRAGRGRGQPGTTASPACASGSPGSSRSYGNRRNITACLLVPLRPADRAAIAAGLQAGKPPRAGRGPLPDGARHVLARSRRSGLEAAGRRASGRPVRQRCRFLRGLGLSGRGTRDPLPERGVGRSLRSRLRLARSRAAQSCRHASASRRGSSGTTCSASRSRPATTRSS